MGVMKISQLLTWTAAIAFNATPPQCRLGLYKHNRHFAFFKNLSYEEYKYPPNRRFSSFNLFYFKLRQGHNSVCVPFLSLLYPHLEALPHLPRGSLFETQSKGNLLSRIKVLLLQSPTKDHYDCFPVARNSSPIHLDTCTVQLSV